MHAQHHDIIDRWEGNPIITPNDLPFSCLNIMNAGATMFQGQIILLIRVELMNGQSVLMAARSKDGIHFIIDDEPILTPATEGGFAEFEATGVEDARITYLDDTYYIVYTANSRHGCRLALAKTDDFKTIERVGLISTPDNKNGALFSKKINGSYARLDRPLEGSNIWITYSEDLVYWGRSHVIMTPRGGTFWDGARIGCAAPPIETKDGWLLIYYGVKNTSGGPIFRMGSALLDLEDPTKVLERCDIPILSPRENYERIGDVSNMIFSCGAVVNKESNELTLYYGAANNAICMGTAKLSTILQRCADHGGCRA